MRFPKKFARNALQPTRFLKFELSDAAAFREEFVVSVEAE